MFDKKTMSVVQVCGFKLSKGSTHVFNELYDMVPSVDTEWEELTEEMPSVPYLSSDPDLLNSDDCTMKQDIVALRFSSVGDCPDGYDSWFGLEVDMTGINEVVAPHRKELFQAIEEKFKGQRIAACSILTLWEGHVWRDYEGEYEFDYDYLGVLKDLKRAL